VPSRILVVVQWSLRHDRDARADEEKTAAGVASTAATISLRKLFAACVDLIYIDPAFNSNRDEHRIVVPLSVREILDERSHGSWRDT